MEPTWLYITNKSQKKGNWINKNRTGQFPKSFIYDPAGLIVPQMLEINITTKLLIYDF